MKKRVKQLILLFSVAALVAASFAACGKKEEPVAEVEETETPTPTPTPTPTETPVVTPEPVEEEPESIPPEGMYFSELTGEPVDLALQEQRPIAVMVDNETIAWPHFGCAEADVTYEIMNSTMNGRITRLMFLIKDWDKIQQMGNVRSTRTTNIPLAAEWNAVLCHDGGPHYINDYLAKGYLDHFSGTFSRIPNGKPREFTEYIAPGDLDKNFNNTGVSRTYNENKPERESHFLYVPYETETDLTEEGGTAASTIVLPFEHTKSTLTLNQETGMYEYSAYGKEHRDGEDDQILAFKNLILQRCSFFMHDDNGYMMYDVVQSDQPGYYITNGKAIPIKWTKETETGLTKYYTEDGEELEINRGKTYISLVPDDFWEQVSIS